MYNCGIEGSKNCWNCNKNINGIHYNIIRHNYYYDYYTRYNEICVIDFYNINGKFCFRRVEIIPRYEGYLDRAYLGSTEWKEY